MKKGRFAFSLILNILILGAAAFGCGNLIMQWFPLSGTVANVGWTDWLKDFGFLAAAFAGIVALIFVVVDIVLLASKKGKVTPRWATVLKLCSAGAAVVAILQYYVVWTVILKDPKLGAAAGSLAIKDNLSWNGGLAVSTVVPLLVIIDFIFVELEPKVKLSNCLWAIAFPLIAMGAVNGYTYIIKPGTLNYHLHSVDYGGAKPITLMEGMGWLFTETVIALLAALIFLAIRNALRKKVIKEEPAPAIAPAPVAPVEEVKPVEETKPVEAKPAEEAKAEEPKKLGKRVIIIKSPDDVIPENIDIREDNNSEETEEAEEVATAQRDHNAPRVYHISRQSTGKWQVKLATGERAIKLFDTQDQAITYAKSLVRTQGGSIRVHALTGKLRKE